MRRTKEEIIEAVKLVLDNKKTKTEVCSIYSMDLRTLNHYITRFSEKGEDGLFEHHRLSLDEKKKLVEQVISGQVTISSLANAKDVSESTLRRWTTEYTKEGLIGLKNKRERETNKIIQILKIVERALDELIKKGDRRYKGIFFEKLIPEISKNKYYGNYFYLLFRAILMSFVYSEPKYEWSVEKMGKAYTLSRIRLLMLPVSYDRQVVEEKLDDPLAQLFLLDFAEIIIGYVKKEPSIIDLIK